MTVLKQPKYLITITLSIFVNISPSSAQMPDRYPQLNDYGHQIYFEQHELPALAHGPTDPAPSPDGISVAFAAQGWIWLLDLETRVATRITDSPNVDSRPRWSPDGQRLAFVRDFGNDTGVVVRNLESGDEQLINTHAVDLDPEFSADGHYLYYANGVSGSISIWRYHLSSGAEQRITDLPKVERNIRRVPGGDRILYLDAQDPHRSLRLRDFVTGQDEIIHAETLTYHLTADVHPNRPLIAYSAPINGDYHLWTMDINDPRVRHRLTDGTHYALTPAFSANGNNIYFVESDKNRQFELKRIKTYGGAVHTIDIKDWNYGVATGRVIVRVLDNEGQPITARVSIVSENGHPVASNSDATYFDTKTGRTYSYIEGEGEMTLPVGRYLVEAARGLLTPLQSAELIVRATRMAEVSLQLTPVWNAREAGYVSVDYHDHLNGDGTSRADHDDAMRLLAGEDLDQVGLMSWNRWERRIDRDILGQQTEESGRVVDQGQEVRSHFHGHIGINGIDVPYEPWFWGPNNPALGDPNLVNADVLTYAKSIGAFPTFVHPGVPEDEPFVDPAKSSFSIDFINELIIQDGVGLEIISGWDGPLGNAQLWYRLLNIGKNVIGVSGTDAWVDFYRTPALGTARNFIPTENEQDDFTSILASVAAGRGFLSTGPALLFELGDDLRPGDVTKAGPQNWSLTISSAVDTDIVEIIVNGQVIDVRDGIKAGETKIFQGTINLPVGGWIAARAYSKDWIKDPWPAMLQRSFAHSQPIWIDHVGSFDSDAFAASASDLLRALDAVELQAREAYGERPMTRIYRRYEMARNILNQNGQ